MTSTQQQSTQQQWQRLRDSKVEGFPELQNLPDLFWRNNPSVPAEVLLAWYSHKPDSPLAPMKRRESLRTVTLDDKVIESSTVVSFFAFVSGKDAKFRTLGLENFHVRVNLDDIKFEGPQKFALFTKSKKRGSGWWEPSVFSLIKSGAIKDLNNDWAFRLRTVWKTGKKQMYPLSSDCLSVWEIRDSQVPTAKAQSTKPTES